MRLLCVTGIKSDYDILYPVLSELKKANHELLIVVSGAHLSDNHNNTYKKIIEDGFKIDGHYKEWIRVKDELSGEYESHGDKRMKREDFLRIHSVKLQKTTFSGQK